MNYRRNKQSTGKNFVIFILLVVFVIVLMTPVGDMLSRAAHRVTVPIWGTAQQVQSLSGDGSVLFISKKSLLDKNNTLQAQLRAVDIQLQEHDLLVAQNTMLLGLLGRSRTEGSIVASVLAKPNRSLYDTLIIDAGEQEGVREGYQVVYYGQAVGVVEKAYARSSKVVLYSSSTESLDVVLAESGIAGVATGVGGGTFEWRLPRDENVAVGDIVIRPGMRQYMIGVVESISSRPSDPFKTILFKSPVNIFDIQYVEVVEGVDREDVYSQHEEISREDVDGSDL